MPDLKLLSIELHHLTPLPNLPDGSPRCHEFDAKTIGAVNAALAAGRPLLVRGEPGLGKTQLAEAVAAELKRAYLPFVVDSRTEHRDLLWRFDAVERLAEAQLNQYREDREKAIRELEVKNFVRPGPLWWVLNWTSASSASTKDSDNPLQLGKNDEFKDNGWVLLIDEIDKAESDVPNGLLEALGSQRFTPFGSSTPIAASGIPPLVIITTNEERTLPPAFIRRCLVLLLQLPTEKSELIEVLVRRGKGHFGERAHESILRLAAEQLWDDRQVALEKQWRPLPGQAEFIDLVRVVVNIHPNEVKKQESLLKDAAQFIMKKHSEI